jgi:glycosyltransferase involved in cell wall biosynthesis
MVKLAYLVPYTAIPSRLASSVHIMKMCDAYVETGIVIPSLFVSKGNEAFEISKVFDHYHLNHSFKIYRHIFSNNKVFRIGYFFFVLPILIKVKRFDVVHTRNLSIAYGCSVLFRIPTILELHDSPGSNERTISIFEKCVKSANLKLIIVITKSLESHIRELVPFVESKLLVLPDGVSEKSLAFNSTKAFEKESLGISYEFICVYTGHLYKGRGIEFIIKLAKSSPDLGFFIVGGNDSHVNFYKELSSGMSNIFFMGFMNQELVLKYQKSADVLLMPYENEVLVAGSRGNSTASYASPLKMFEYMATGSPIVSSQLPVLSEILSDGENAIMLPYGDLVAWLNAIRKIQAFPNFDRQLADKARRDVSNFTWEKRAKKITTILNSLKL